jgi:hypothetical protein
MSNYFRYFPREFYLFGNEKMADTFQDITRYADVIDQVRDSTTVYRDYYIQDNERPDQTSYRLYGNPNFYWTFYLMNQNIREQGWPLSNTKVLKYAQKNYPNKTITTRNDLTSLTGFFKTGDTVTGRTSAATGKIVHRYMDLGQLVVKETSGTFVTGENLNTDLTTQIINAHSVEEEYNAAHHYEDSNGVFQDISDLTAGPGASQVEVTVLDRIYRQNVALRQIRVIKDSLIQEVVKSFREAIAS